MPPSFVAGGVPCKAWLVVVPLHRPKQAKEGRLSTLPETDPDNIPRTAAEQRTQSSGGNRAVAMLLVCVTLVLLGGALGVGLLVLYGPF
ncbi:MAG: hypothetical protein CL949_02285 [Erythrobacter sp.]|nr:hypothetical protein [Erythrobacter sp.]|tara:strand:- start:186 stop:452 length:267 start_codon:yes stop_codon:yes gene_type:complete